MKAQGIFPILICLLAVFTAEMSAPVVARGEWIILNSGEKFQTDRSWQEDGRLKFRLNGLVVSVPENDVAQVVTSETTPERPVLEGQTSPSNRQMNAMASDTLQSKRKERLQTALRLPLPDQKFLHKERRLPVPPDTVTRQQRHSEPPDNAVAEKTTASPETPPSAPAVTPPSRTVFRNLAWGMHPSSMPGLVFSQTKPAYGGVDEFFFPDENLKLGDAPLNGIVYGFWHKRLYTITIWTDGRPSYEKLRGWVIATYGPGHQRKKDVERQVWYGKGTDQMLEFDETLNTGIFWLRSHALHDRIMQIQTQ
jgi:hypothetical protein